MKTLVTGALGATGAELELLRDMGLEVTLHPDERRPVERPGQYQAVICNGLFLYQDISAFTSLEVVQLTSAGLDRAPVEYMREHGIRLYHAAGVYSVPMAEWTIMRLLELYKNAARLYENQAACRWEKDRSWGELWGKTACVVGCGAYGAQTAKLLKAFGVRVLMVNRTRKECPWADEFCPLEGLESCLAQADMVILAVALTDQTRGLMDSRRLGAMKPGAVLVNAARGGLVEGQALLEALSSGHLAGVALDVLETEPLPADSPLWRTDRVLLSPHNSFVGENTHRRLMELVCRNLKQTGQ